MAEITKSYQWTRLFGSITGALSFYKHYCYVDGRGHAVARCGMIVGPVKRGFFSNLFARRCRKCLVSERADLRSNASC